MAVNIANRAWKAIKAQGSRAISIILPSWQDNQASWRMTNFESYVNEGFLRNELIHACIMAKADTTSSVAFKVYDKHSHEELPEHPLQKLLSRPNPFMSEVDFWKHTMMHLDLAGVSYWEKVRSSAGVVIELWPIRPDYIAPIRESRSFISGYKYKRPGQTGEHIFDRKDILVFANFSPAGLDEYYSPVQVAARSGDVDNALTEYLKLFFEHGGTPPVVISSKMKLHPNDVDRMRNAMEQKYGGYRNWITPMVLDSDSTLQKVGFNFKEMAFDLIDGRNETRICQVMRVPPIIISTTFGLSRGTFSNYESARKAWWEDDLMPIYKKLADRTNADLGLEFNDEVYVKADYSQVAALQEDRDSRWARATAALNAGDITVNDSRRERGLSDIGKVGDVFLRGNMVSAVPLLESGAEDEDDADPDAEENEDAEKTAILHLVEKRHDKPVASTADDVPDFTSDEIDSLYDAWRKLPRLKKAV